MIGRGEKLALIMLSLILKVQIASIKDNKVVTSKACCQMHTKRCYMIIWVTCIPIRAHAHKHTHTHTQTHTHTNRYTHNGIPEVPYNGTVYYSNPRPYRQLLGCTRHHGQDQCGLCLGAKKDTLCFQYCRNADFGLSMFVS